MRYLDKHTTRDKRLLRLERERVPLWRALRDAPVVPMEKPYQLGWTKTHALERDVLRRPDAQVFACALAVINRTVWSRTQDFQLRNGEPVVLRPRIIPPRQWRRLARPTSHTRLFSFGYWKDETEPCAKGRKRRLHIGYAVHSLWWLLEDLRPRMATHRRVDLPEVRKRIAEIDARLAHHRGRRRLAWLHGHRLHWRVQKTIVERRIAEATDFSVKT